MWIEVSFDVIYLIVVWAVVFTTTDDAREVRCGGISVHSGVGWENAVQLIGEILTQKSGTDYRRGSPGGRALCPVEGTLGQPTR
jgi:hypothetical protein